MVVATDVARARQPIIEEELPHQEEVGCVDHQLQPGSKAAVSLVKTELTERHLLFPLSLIGQRALERRSPLIGARIGGQPQSRDQPLLQRLGKILFEFVDDPLLADERDSVRPLLPKDPVGKLRRSLEVPLPVGQSVALHVVRLGGIEAFIRGKRLDGADRLFVAELISRHRCLLFRYLDHQDPTLLLKDRLERLNVGIEVDGQRVRDPDRKRHHPVETGTLLEDDEGASSLRLESFEEGAHVGEVLGDTQALGMGQRFDVRFAGFEFSVAEAIEDGQEQRMVADQPLAGEVQVQADDRTLSVLAADLA